MKYEEWLENWLEHYIKPTAKERTHTRYCEIVRQHIAPHLGGYELEELTPMVMQKFVTYLSQCGNLRTGAGLSPNSVNSVITVIQGSLETANRIGVTAAYTADKIRRPKVTEKQVSCFTPAEQKRIEQAVMQDKKPKMFGILLCLYSGLRVGEGLALEWSDVDLVRSELTVSKTCHDGKDQDGRFCRVTDTPKTESSCRVIPIPRQLLPHLREVKRKSTSKYVVSNGDGIISVRSYQKTFSALLSRLGIAHRGFHSLRHTFATRALECGMDIKTLSEILGHKSPTTTLNRYVHSMMEYKKEMMNRLGKLL